VPYRIGIDVGGTFTDPHPRRGDLRDAALQAAGDARPHVLGGARGEVVTALDQEQAREDSAVVVDPASVPVDLDATGALRGDMPSRRPAEPELFDFGAARESPVAGTRAAPA
jgi:hypothetical protein